MVERLRGLHEEAERRERAVARDFLGSGGGGGGGGGAGGSGRLGHRGRLEQSHRARRSVAAAAAAAAALAEGYADADGELAEEVARLGGAKTDAFGAFYADLRELRSYHRAHPGLAAVLPEEREAALLAERSVPAFSGEEGRGRYLDLLESFESFRAVARRPMLEYVDYLEIVDDFSALPSDVRARKGFKKYCRKLLAYLEDFLERAEPLAALGGASAEAGTRFDAAWEERGEAPLLPGDEAAETGADGGGTGAEARAGAKGGAQGGKGGKEPPPLPREARRAEYQVAHLLRAALAKQLAATRARATRKVTQTAAERAEEAEAEVGDGRGMDGGSSGDEDSADSDDEAALAGNPLKLPLGWDGRPIPYWMYKLHGLNQEFRCEICGDHVYRGRREFERHFQQARHLQGMRALGIPNRRIFHEITKIEDARRLWAQLEGERARASKAADDEEFEDAEGNVYGRKTFEDLKRQGLI